MIDQWSRIVQAGLPAPVCLLCGDAGADGLDLCAACRAELPVAAASCGRCALPLPAAASAGALCGVCQRQAPAYVRCLAAFVYAPPLDHLLLGLKFNARLVVARSLGGLMADRLGPQISAPPDCLLPVPLHPARLRERGFNQSLELARPLARRLGVPLDVASCRRLRNTPPQAALDARHRHRNLRGAFGVTGRLPGRIAIIDDVMTTGSTVQALAQTLRDAGADEVEVWVCARAGTDR